MKGLFCLKAKNGLGRFALSALPRDKDHSFYKKIICKKLFNHALLFISNFPYISVQSGTWYICHVEYDASYSSGALPGV